MNLYDWLLFLHVLSAFLVVGALTALWALVLGTRAAAPMLAPESAMRFGRSAGILVGAGMMGAIVFGIWLAIDVDGYELWDGWILAAIILWLVSAEVGRRVGRAVAADGEGTEAGATGRARTLYWLLAAITLVFLLLMIFKPGA